MGGDNHCPQLSFVNRNLNETVKHIEIRLLKRLYKVDILKCFWAECGFAKVNEGASLIPFYFEKYSNIRMPFVKRSKETRFESFGRRIHFFVLQATNLEIADTLHSGKRHPLLVINLQPSVSRLSRL